MYLSIVEFAICIVRQIIKNVILDTYIYGYFKTNRILMISFLTNQLKVRRGQNHSYCNWHNGFMKPKKCLLHATLFLENKVNFYYKLGCLLDSLQFYFWLEEKTQFVRK